MRYKLLGRTGLRVSEAWLGTMVFGEEAGWGASEATCARLVDQYLDAGGNVIDTADVYTGGRSEEIVGRLLETRRERVVLSTKFSLTPRPDDPNGGGGHRRRLVEALDASLQRLRTDRIDVFWVHVRDALTPLEETMRALDDQVRLGKVLYVAVSNWPAWEIARANTMAELRDWTPFAAVQASYNLLERTPERELVPMTDDLGLSMVAWSPLAGGHLTGKYLDGATGRMTVLGDGAVDARTEAVVRETVAVAGELGAAPSQVALAWLLARPGGVVPILGATKEQQLAENLGALDVALAPEHVARLDAASAIDLGFPHDFLMLDIPRSMIYGDQVDRVARGGGRVAARRLFG